MENQNKEKIELSDQEFLEAVKTAGLEKNFKSYLQKEGDRRLTEGLKTYQKNLEKKDSSDSEKIINLENELKEIKDTNLKNTLNNSIKASLKVAGLSEGFAKYIQVDKEEDIGTAIKDLNDNILGLKQEAIDNQLKGDNPPLKGDKTGTGSGMETAVREYAKKINPKE